VSRALSKSGITPYSSVGCRVSTNVIISQQVITFAPTIYTPFGNASIGLSDLFRKRDTTSAIANNTQHPTAMASTM
jgi:hypothetical protein